jgi:hypothetical protein
MWTTVSGSSRMHLILTGTMSSETCCHRTAPEAAETWKTSAQILPSLMGLKEEGVSFDSLYAFLMRGVQEQLNLFPITQGLVVSRVVLSLFLSGIEVLTPRRLSRLLVSVTPWRICWYRSCRCCCRSTWFLGEDDETSCPLTPSILETVPVAALSVFSVVSVDNFVSWGRFFVTKVLSSSRLFMADTFSWSTTTGEGKLWFFDVMLPVFVRCLKDFFLFLWLLQETKDEI